MAYGVQPSLLYIALVKTASEVCRIPEIKTFIAQAQKPWGIRDITFVYSSDWVSLINEKVALLEIPVELKEKLVHFIRPIALKIKEWLTCHTDLLQCDNSAVYLQSSLQWRTNGTIDDHKTGICLARNENLSVEDRFLLSQVYYLEDDAYALGQKQPGTPQNTVSIEEFRCTAYETMMEMLESNFSIYGKLREFYCNSPGVLKHFFTKVDTSAKFDILKKFMDNNCAEMKVVHFSFMELSEKERQRLYERYASVYLISFLEWPLQHNLLAVADLLWSFICKEDFLDLLEFIYKERIEKSWEEYDYIGLLRNFWLKGHEDFRDFVRYCDHFLKQISTEPLGFLKLI
ncbi:uncharacterized protein TNCV_2455911 [Trichonephila clavipes]|nr:uncharacterized protein TNCV_2455911 [Trichonephila clavipes]